MAGDRYGRLRIAFMDNYKFIDLFSGCGGFSLGLALAGLRGQFAVERDAMAFKTFAYNLLQKRGPVRPFAWPGWLEKRAWAIDEILDRHSLDLGTLRGQIDLIAGGPPCQGFSFAGRRNESDPRNLLFEKYVEVVNLIRPSILVLENVPGMKVAHVNKEKGPDAGSVDTESYYEKLRRRLLEVGYVAEGRIVDASAYGVPQRRSRLIVIGMREELSGLLGNGIAVAFDALEEARLQLQIPRRVSAKSALSDLETAKGDLQECKDTKGYEELSYKVPSTAFQKRMHEHCHDGMNSMRLARHRDDVRERFRQMQEVCGTGKMSEKHRADFGLSKHRIHLMAPNEPAPTITTLPDDILHYSEPRILTVRECARLQSFPDWFHFQGKYTTGGHMRTKECPRYTQVGNAVPPDLAKTIGMAVTKVLGLIRLAESQQKRALPNSRHRVLEAA